MIRVAGVPKKKTPNPQRNPLKCHEMSASPIPNDTAIPIRLNAARFNFSSLESSGMEFLEKKTGGYRITSRVVLFFSGALNCVCRLIIARRHA
jgi:hypothetical protein